MSEVRRLPRGQSQRTAAFTAARAFIDPEFARTRETEPEPETQPKRSVDEFVEGLSAEQFAALDQAMERAAGAVFEVEE